MKMILLRLAQSFLFFVYLENVNSNILVRGVISVRSTSSLVKCTAVCEKTFPLTSNKIAGSECCSRGCRFYGISELSTQNKQAELNTSKEACHNCCYESYSDHYDKAACNMGCDSMAKHHSEMLQTFGYRISKESLPLEIEDGSQVLQTGEMSEPDDVLTDPGLRRQVLVDLILFDDKRLPEVRVKTLPVEFTATDGCGQWWSVRRVGVPRCLATSLLLLFILLVLCFGLFYNKSALPSPPICYDPEEAPPLPPKYSLVVEVKA